MQIHQQAWETFTHLTRAMTKAALVILEYGQRYPHTTHLVLMQGSLTLLQEPQSGRRRSSKRQGRPCRTFAIFHCWTPGHAKQLSMCMLAIYKVPLCCVFLHAGF